MLSFSRILGSPEHESDISVEGKVEPIGVLWRESRHSWVAELIDGRQTLASSREALIHALVGQFYAGTLVRGGSRERLKSRLNSFLLAWSPCQLKDWADNLLGVLDDATGSKRRALTSELLDLSVLCTYDGFVEVLI